MDRSAIFELNSRFQKSAEQECLIPLSGPPISYGNLWANAEKKAEDWLGQGLGRGEVIVFSFPNHSSHLCAYLACAIGGFIACPIVESLHPELKKQLLALVKPRLIVDKPFELEEKIFSVPKTDLAGSDCQPFLLPFTSGSTGQPKAIALSLAGVIGGGAAFARHSGMSEGTRLYHHLPMGYMAGILNAFFAPILAGGVVVEGPLFSPLSMKNFWDRPLALNVNTLSLTPTIAAALCRLPRGEESSGLKQVQCTSAPISLGLRKKFYDKFSLPLQNCYGMTEIGGPLTFQNAEDAKSMNDLSDPLPELEFSLRGESGQDLWLRSPYMMLGYRNENGQIDLPTDDKNFLDTGDRADLSGNKIQITGRKKDLIIRGGINISPGRIESILSLAPGAAEVAVVGLAHSFWGEAIVAFVMAGEGAVEVEKAMKIFAREALGAHERPDHILLVEKLPKSFIGKIQKDILRKMAEERLASH